MNYPLSRHYQRYEYIVMSGLVHDKNALDVGCGYGYGTMILAKGAKNVMGIDPIIGKNAKMSYMECYQPRRAEQIDFLQTTLEDFKPSIDFDVAVAIEVFEHVENPMAFIDRLAEITPEIFLTTPLAQKTATTRNPDHINEYSYEDFIGTIETRYIPQRILFQTGNMKIRDYGIYTGDSMDVNHTVQMCYATRR